MKLKMWKKLLASVLAITLVPVGSMAPATSVNAAETGHKVEVVQEGDSITIGNDYISREFSVAGNKVSTTSITNKRTNGGNTVFTPAEGSEEFKIRTTIDTPEAISQEGWSALADSYHGATPGAGDGPAANLIDGNPNTHWHTNYGGGAAGDTAFPFNVVFRLAKETTFQCFSYLPRQDSDNGKIADYELWISTKDSDTTLPVDDASWVKVKTDTFTSSGRSIAYVNMDQPTTAKQIKLVALTPANAAHGYATGAEFNLYEEKLATSGADREFASSALTLAGAPKVEDTTATINNVEKTGKKITFSYAPYTFKNVEYTINEVIVMYDGDHFMRKYMEISVPEAQRDAAVIDYIDLESMNVNETDATWTVPTDKGGIVQMSRFKANLGQPIYIQGMFFGCEFPETNTEIVNGTGFMRYYTGKSFTRFGLDNQLTTDGKYVTWQTVAGAARSATEQDVIQADFFEYINSIATPSDFRIQYNSWFDNMMLISDENILESFIEIDRELNKVETRPLDSYVVDDGWVNYNDTHVVDANRAGTTLNQTGFWEFNSKFPNGLTTSSELVKKFGSNFGVWVGPRGGYNFYGSLADIMTKAGTGSKAGGSIDVADRTYVKNFTNMAVKWQEDYDVNYWKWDGFADGGQYNHFAAADGVPGYANRHMTGGYEHMYHVTDLWEAWIDLFEAVRESEQTENINKLWISLTCYVNPSPWFLQWGNSVWIQCVHDQQDAGSSSSKMDRQLTYRDACYYDFIKNHEFQFPLSNIYNHDPVYGVEGTGMNMNTATDAQFQNYLYMMSTRGTAFWELYYSDSIMTEGKYEVTAEFLAWAEENYHMLRNAKMFGASPRSGLTLQQGANSGESNAYGFACFDGNDGIMSVRNADTTEKSVTIVFDRNLGVPEDAGTLQYHIEHSHNLTEGTAQTGEFTYGQEYTFTLQPDEVRIFRVSKAGDTTAPEYTRAYINENNELIVRFNEKVQNGTFTVNGMPVEAVQSADDITYHINAEDSLLALLEDDMELTIKAEGLTDMAGNALEETEITTTYHENHVVATTSGKNGAATIEASATSLQSNDGFTVRAKVYTTTAGAVVAQGSEYALGINEDGTAYFTLNGVTAKSTAVVNDGTKVHSITGVKENNGILKLYVDGTLEGSAYGEANRYYEVKAADINVSNALTATVYDVAYGYDEVEALEDTVVEDDRTAMTITADQLTANGGTSEGAVANILDGNNTTFWTSNKADAGIAKGNPSVVVDLGENKMIDRVDYTKRFFDSSVNIWKCTGNLRAYVIEVSTNGTDWTEVSAGYTFEDENYPAALDGGTTKINFKPVKARYVRISGTASYHHEAANVDKFMTVADLKLYESSPSNVAEKADVTAKWTADGSDAVSTGRSLAVSVDGKKNDTNAYADFGGNRADSSYFEVNLGEVNLIETINLYRYWGDSRTYNGTVIAISDRADFSNPVVVYNSDAANKHGFGAGTDTTYAETADGLSIDVVAKTGDSVRARYIRVYMCGSSANASNHIIEFEAIGYDANEVDAKTVKLNAEELELAVAGTATLTATVTPANVTDKVITWSSSNTAVATVADGVVTAVAEGTAVITAMTANGLTATCEVIVCNHATTEVQNAVEATCQTEGYTGDKVCTTCGKVVEAGQAIPVDADAHKLDEGKETTAPTCEVAGVKTFTCTNEGCTYTKTEEIPATKHAMGEWKESKAPTCTVAGEKVQKCTNEGCTYEVKEEVPAKGHTFGEWKESKAPTCATAGEDTRTCSVCNESEKRTGAAATGNHSWDKGTTTAPTATKKGVKTYTCTVCKTTKKETVEVKKGTTFTNSKDKATYKVTKAGKNGTVTFVKTKNTGKTITVPATVKIAGVNYKVTAIEKNAFKNNKKANKIVISKNVSKIGATAFQNCIKLKEIKIQSTTLKKNGLTKTTFRGVKKSVKVTVPKAKVKAYKTLFQKNAGLDKKVKVVK